MDMQLLHFGDCMQNVACWASLLKILFWDGTGLCLFTKRIDRGNFFWPRLAEPGDSVTLSPAQLAMLLEGIDWRTPERFWRPLLAG